MAMSAAAVREKLPRPMVPSDQLGRLDVGAPLADQLGSLDPDALLALERAIDASERVLDVDG